MVEIKGFRTSHFLEHDIAPRICGNAGPMGLPNVLKVSLLAAIYSLHDKGWSRWRIAHALGLNRETIGRLAKPAISTAGLEEPCQAKPAISTTGPIPGRKSQCEPLAEAILAKVEVGLSAPRIYRDLVEEKGFADSYVRATA